MAILEWSDELNVGVNSMNDQHKVLLDLMNTLHDKFKAQAEFEELKVTLDLLKDKTIKHFKDEEAFMESFAYEKLKSHKAIHKQLLENFGKHYQSFLDEKALNDDFFNFLQLWLRAHIKGIDKQYGEASKKAA